MLKVKKARRAEAGYTALEMMICIAVMLQMLILASSWMRRNSEHWSQTMAARHLTLVSAAAKYYVQDHLDQLLSNWTEGEVKILAVEQLQSDGYLPLSFRNQNPFQQSACVYLRCLSAEPSNNSTQPPKLVQILTVTLGGKNLSDTETRAVADAIGGEGGYLFSAQTKQRQVNEDEVNLPTWLLGSCGGWSLEADELTEVSAGHPVALTYVSSLDGTTVSNDYLRRIKPLSTSKYNVMQTHFGIRAEKGLYFLREGEEEITPEDEESTSLKSKLIRLGKEAYWNEDELKLNNKLYFKDGKLTFESEEGSLELSAEGITATRYALSTSWGEGGNLETKISPEGISVTLVETEIARLGHECFVCSPEDHQSKIVAGDMGSIKLQCRGQDFNAYFHPQKIVHWLNWAVFTICALISTMKEEDCL